MEIEKDTARSLTAGAIGGAVVATVGVPATIFLAGLGAIGFAAYKIIATAAPMTTQEQSADQEASEAEG